MAEVAERNKKGDGASATNTPVNDSRAAKIARFALGSIFGIIFLALCFIMLSAALRGPDTLVVEGVSMKAGVIPGQKLPTDELKVGDIAPDFVLNQLGGGPVQLSKFRGKVVFINFWATWCTPCREEMKDINDFYRAHKNDSSVVILTVNQKEDDNSVKAFFKDNGGFTVPVAMDRDSSVAGAYYVTKFPESYFLDKNCKIVAIKRGQLTAEEIKQYYEQALKSS